MILRAPAPLVPEHRTDDFGCGEPVLDKWLRHRALVNQATEAGRTFVVADGDRAVLGFYALAVAAVAHHDAKRAIRQKMPDPDPDPIPVMVLARLAVDLRAQGMNLGSALLQDALHRTLQVSGNAGVRALLVHALHERARQFYEHFGFRASPSRPMTLMLRIDRKR